MKGIGVADRKFAKLSKFIKIGDLVNDQNGIEIFLD